MDITKYIETIIPQLGKTKIKFYDNALFYFDLYDRLNEFTRQKNIKHLGIISDIFDGANHTRYDYLMLQCKLIEIFEDMNKGVINSELGSITIDKRKILGNSLLKSWALFSNLGHLKNTFADERVLLKMLKNDIQLRKSFLDNIKDIQLKNYSKAVIFNEDISKFHYLIALYQVYKSIYNQHNNHFIIEPIKAFLLDESCNVSDEMKLKKLKSIFKTIRLLSIVGLDSQFTHVPFSINLTTSLLSISYWEEYYSDKHYHDFLETFMSILRDEIYQSPAITNAYKEYELNSIKRLASGEIELNFDSLVQVGLNEGYYVKNDNGVSLIHFFRMEIVKSCNERSEIYEYISEYFDNAEESYYSVEYDDNKRGFFVDFFISKNISKDNFAKLYYKICECIENQFALIAQEKYALYEDRMSTIDDIELSDKLIEEFQSKTLDIIVDIVMNESEKYVTPLFQSLLWATLRFILNENLRFDINFTSDKYNFFGIDSLEYKSLSNNLAKAIDLEKNNEDRVHELKQLNHSLKFKKTGYRLGCIARIDIYDSIKRPNESKVTDIDGVIIKSTEKALLIELHESKNRRNAENLAKKDLNKKLVRTLNKGINYRILEVKTYGAKLQIELK